ncbi:hypothetical protein Glove_258g56 [Diversispora epigaea]|uniref:Uncharacterized protein n=1 Tax=Diversispora epigaea TaxID=1348612 RepID=A0A397IEF3_9GLOM|nr:hypothetical protein Glove_258g56 [Diversispora epigaea]
MCSSDRCTKLYVYYSDVILEANGFLENLEICSYHFNHDQNKLHNSKDKQLKSTLVSILNRRRCLFCGKLFYFFTRGNGCSKHSRKLLDKNIQIVYNGQYTCNALGECYPICKLAFEDIKNPRYICLECYELKGDHFHVKPNKGKLSVSCIKQKYHDDVVKKNIEIIAYKINKNQFDISVSTNQTQSIAKSSNTLLDTLIPALTKLSFFFMVRTLTCLNRIPIYPDEKKLEERDFKKFGEIVDYKIWQSYKYLKNNQKYLQSLTSITEYIDAFSKFLKIFFKKMFLQLEIKKITQNN